MPRISSTSCITGTGFMKWMPMKRSGRSVAAASRVIEIDEVFVATSASGRSDMGTERREDLSLGRLVLGRGLDHQVAGAELVEAAGRDDALARHPGGVASSMVPLET